MTTIEDLRPAHLNDAAELVASAYRRERECEPSLPARFEDAAEFLPWLENLCGKAAGVAAVEGGKLVGFLLGMDIPSLKGTERGTHCPEWAHAAGGDDRAGTYHLMYRHLAARWVGSGCFTHVLTLFAHDREAVEAWFETSFGLLVIDACRPLGPVAGVGRDPRGAGRVAGADCLATGLKVEVRQAGPEGIPLVLPLGHGLQRHLASAPTFLPRLAVEDEAHWGEWLARPDHHLWLALLDGQAVAYIRGERSTEEACYVIRDPATFSLTGAYTAESLRGRGVASRLLGVAVEWARANGYARCTVDFESANTVGREFWLRHFEPIAYSLIRRVDERIAWAHP